MVRFEKWWWLVICTSGLAFAQAPGLMPLPLEVKRTPSGFSKEDREVMQREYTRLVRLTGAQIPDFARYDVALQELGRQDCAREDECLVQLARKAESLYALYASLDYTVEGAVQVTGRVVRDDGKVASATQVVRLAKAEGAFQDQATLALTQLFTQLKLRELPAVRPVETREPAREVAVTAPPPSVSRSDDSSGSGQGSTGRAVFIAGAGAVVAGGAALVAGEVLGGGLKPDASGNLPPGQLADFQAARALSTAGFLGLAAGSAVAVVGALIWGLAPSAQPGLRVSAIAGPQAGMITVQGAF